MIRAETPADYAAVYRVNAIAFGREYDAPEGAFRVLALVPKALDDCQGLVTYRPEFNDCE